MRHAVHYYILTWLLCICIFLPITVLGDSGATTENVSEPVVETPQAKQPDPALSNDQKTSLIEFYTWAGVLPRELMALHSALDSNIYDNLKNQYVPKLTADIRDLQWEVVTAKTSAYLQKMHIDRFQRSLTRLQFMVDSLEKSLTDDVEKLSAKRNVWIGNKTKLKSFLEQEDLVASLPTGKNDELNKTINEAMNLIEDQLRPALLLGDDISNLQVRLQAIHVDLRILDKKFIESRSLRTVPTLLSLDFYKQINAELFHEIYNNIKNFLTLHGKLLRENKQFLLMGSLIFIILCCMISISRKMVLASSRWYPFAISPIATALILLAACYQIFNKSLKNVSFDFENQWTLFINIATMLAVIRLVRKSINERWKRVMFIRLSVYMVIIMLLATLEMPQILMLLFVFWASLGAFIIYITQLRVQCHTALQRILRNTWGVIPAVIIVASLAGYDQLAIFLFSTLIASIGVCLVIWMLFHLISGLIELLLKLSPYELIRKNISVIVRSLQPFIALAHLMLALGILSVILDIYPSPDVGIKELYNFGIDFVGLHISPGFMLTIFIVLYGAILFSRAVQALLLNEVLPHYNAEKGVQLSITRLVHYAILTIGFLVMLKFLGFELQQLTILGGALGVGIGFGLQAIVNNFVGGLILLFERPIKVGDTIQVGTELGEVKNLGLRATIIQTFDNSEIVVPNSDLVTGQVTNWTLDERKVRVRIPVGVAYGTDVSKVLEILNSCALAHPMVLNTPKPTALFLAFGASSLDFELRFWIPEFLDKMTATSEMNQSIESEFALNNIEIPFPQNDLHIRSVSEAAATAFGSKGTKPRQEDDRLPVSFEGENRGKSQEKPEISPDTYETENKQEPL